MPKRTNRFQQVIHAIHLQFADGASVTESKLLRDRATGEEREVDVVIEQMVGIHTVVIGVECTSTGRPADVGWVEQMTSKHEHLTDKLVLVSMAGFTSQAARKAKANAIDTYSLAEALAVDWTKIVGKLPCVYLALPEMRPTHAAIFPKVDNSSISPDTTLFADEEQPQGSLAELAMAALHTDHVLNFVFTTFGEPGDYAFLLGFQPPSESFIKDEDGTKHVVKRIEFRIAVHLDARTPVELEHRAFGQAQIAYGTFTKWGVDNLLTVVESPDRGLSADVQMHPVVRKRTMRKERGT